MKVSVDDVELFTLTPVQKQIIQNDIPLSTPEDTNFFENDMKRRLSWVLITEKVAKCAQRLKAEWEQKLLERGVRSVPTDLEEFAALVFTQPDYKDRATRETEAKAEADAIAASTAVSLP